MPIGASCWNRLHRGQRRRSVKRIVFVLVGLLVIAEVALSFAWPHVVPRLGVLPRPASASWNDGCNDHHRYFTRSGPFWGVNEDSTVKACRSR
jgi:hypothetical protein